MKQRFAQLPAHGRAVVVQPTRRRGALPALLVLRIKIAHRPRRHGEDNEGVSHVVPHHGVKTGSGVAESTRLNAVHRVTVPAGVTIAVVTIGSVEVMGGSSGVRSS